jgi:hypothetical protein
MKTISTCCRLLNATTRYHRRRCPMQSHSCCCHCPTPWPRDVSCLSPEHATTPTDVEETDCAFVFADAGCQPQRVGVAMAERLSQERLLLLRGTAAAERAQRAERAERAERAAPASAGETTTFSRRAPRTVTASLANESLCLACWKAGSSSAWSFWFWQKPWPARALAFWASFFKRRSILIFSPVFSHSQR